MTALLLLALLPGTALASPGFPAPELNDNNLVELRNTANLTAYSLRHREAAWVFYALGEDELRACVPRSGSFHADPRLRPEDASEPGDFSGFDRGHLSPAADNRWSRTAMRESFRLSNVSPQPPAFNQGIWARLEGLVRAWALDLGGLWVATGPLLRDGLPTTGASQVAVPEFFWKVLGTRSGKTREAIAFLLPVNASGSLERYAMPVDRLEELTGIDFLPGLEGEAALEAELHPERWNFRAAFRPLPCNTPLPFSLAESWWNGQAP